MYPHHIRHEHLHALNASLVQVWTFYDYAASSVFWTTGFIAFPSNLYLLYLIFFKSPKNLRIYKVFLANVAIGDLIFSLATTIAQIRIIPNKWAFAYICLGPAGHFFGSEGCYFTYTIMLHSLFYTFLCFPLSFGFRYYILVRSAPKVKDCVMVCLGLWLVALAQHILFICSESPGWRIRQYLKHNKPFYDLDAFPISGNHMIESPLTSITLASIVLPMFPIYLLVIYFYNKVDHFLTENAKMMQSSTVIGHRRLMRALTVQCTLPILFIFPPITLYGLYHLEFVDYTVIEYLVYTMFSFFPAVSPLVTLYYVRPFNRAVRALLRIEISEKTGSLKTDNLPSSSKPY